LKTASREKTAKKKNSNGSLHNYILWRWIKKNSRAIIRKSIVVANIRVDAYMWETRPSLLLRTQELKMRVKRLSILLMFIPTFSIAPLLSEEPGPEQKKILILSSNGGHGHNAAAATLKTILGKRYDIKIVYPIDQLRIWGVKSGEKFYNTMLQYGWVQSMNFITKHVAPKLFRTRKKKLEKLVSRYINEERPDIVISLIPFINFPACEAARKKEIPYLLITTDNDLRNWVHGLQGATHPRFKVTVGSDLPSTRELLKRRKLSDAAIETIGLPLRPDFWAEKNLSSLFEEYRIPPDKSVILLMMGGAGASCALDYATQIGKLDLGAHLIVCVGKNEKLARKLKKLELRPGNSMTVMPFTDKVADLMALSDLIITKPGPGTINEALAMKIPMLIDTTTTPLSWEKANIDLVIQYGVGDRVSDLKNIEPLLRKYLQDPENQARIEKAFSKIPPNLFHERIHRIIETI